MFNFSFTAAQFRIATICFSTVESLGYRAFWIEYGEGSFRINAKTDLGIEHSFYFDENGKRQYSKEKDKV